MTSPTASGMIHMSTWSVQGIRDAMAEGENGLDVKRWGVGLPFRAHAILCVVSLYDTIFENPKKNRDDRLELAMKEYKKRAHGTQFDMSPVLTRQLMFDMYDSVNKVVKADKEGMA